MILSNQPKFQFGEEVLHSVKMRCYENPDITRNLILNFTVVSIALNDNEYEYDLTHEGYIIHCVPEATLVNGEEQ